MGGEAWRRREDTRRGDMAHGITFVMYERRTPNVRGECAAGSRKLHAEGTASLTLALDQHKYGDEIIAQLFTKEPYSVAERRADGWTRLQLFLGPADLETAQALESMAAEIRKRIERRRATP